MSMAKPMRPTAPVNWSNVTLPLPAMSMNLKALMRKLSSVSRPFSFCWILFRSSFSKFLFFDSIMIR